jgi:accessory gene regulator protein AgrB
MSNLFDALGNGLGPALISLFIIAFGRVLAFNIANLFWVACGILELMMFFTFAADEQRLSALMKKKADEMAGKK